MARFDCYSGLAEWQSKWPEYSIFRRFGAMNARNLLYMQAELMHLEDELQQITEEDMEPDKRLSYHKNWLELSKPGTNGGYGIQWEKMKEIRAKLNEYSKPRTSQNSYRTGSLDKRADSALLQFKELFKLQRPTKHDFSNMKYWLERKEFGDIFLTESGFEGEVWDHETDLVALWDDHTQRDMFSAWFDDTFMGWIHRGIVTANWRKWVKKKIAFAVSLISPRNVVNTEGESNTHPADRDVEKALEKTRKVSLKDYKDSRLNLFTQFIVTIVASVLPAVAIIVLYFIHNLLARLGAVAGFSVVFATCLSVFTTAARIETFAATAA